MYPFSRGSSHAAPSFESFEPSPQINLRILSDPAEPDVLAAGVAYGDSVLSSSTVQFNCQGDDREIGQ